MERPATARAFAESPSVRISVQSCEFLLPASLASSSLGMPRILVTFLAPRSCRPRSTFCFAFAQSRIISTTPLFITCFRNFSESSQAEPNLDCFVVNVSLVCESNAGFSMRQLMKIQMWFFTLEGLISMPPRFFPLTTFRMASTTCSVTCTTWVPPLIVLIELTKLTCWKPPSVRLTHTSQRSEHCSKICGTPCLVSRYRSVYSLKFFTSNFSPLRNTVHLPPVDPQMSYTRLVIRDVMSLSRVDIPNLARSGLKMTLV
mmetsp:Transcript_51855/g.112427  ORF Transcript_51855/g.112427 Transcript_51855/m.112427 type:complete len:259 (+) Transcript_51855:682-1458(+)